MTLARRDALIAVASQHGPVSAKELVSLETGAFDSRAPRQPGPSPGAIAALTALEASAMATTDSERSPDAHPSEIVQRLTELHHLDGARIDALGKAAASSHRVHRALERWPIASIARIIEATGLQVQAVTSSLHRLRGLGIVRQITRRHRHRLYCYDAWLALLDADVERVLSERGDAP